MPHRRIPGILDAIRAANAEGCYILAEAAHEIAVHAVEDPLIPREIGVLEMVAERKPNKLIARELAVSEDAMKAHLRSIFSKLNVSDRTQAISPTCFGDTPDVVMASSLRTRVGLLAEDVRRL